MLAAASGASGAAGASPPRTAPPTAAAGRAAFDYAAFERADDAPDLEGALKMYRACRGGCLEHMTRTLHPVTGFDWHLRNYAPFVEAHPEDAEALNKRWAGFTALMSEEQLAALADRSILTVGEWSVLGNSRAAEETARAKQRAVCAKILNNPKRNDVLRLLRRIEGGERYCKAYTRDVHAQLKALAAPLRSLVRDQPLCEAGDEAADEAAARTRAVGCALHALGGMRAQTAVALAMADLLEAEVPELGLSVESTLNFRWDGCGDWCA
jgi:hypothetical protein